MTPLHRFHSESRLGWRTSRAVTLPPHTELREDRDFLYLYGDGGEMLFLVPAMISRESLQAACDGVRARRFDDEWRAERVYGDPSLWRNFYGGDGGA